MIPAPAARDFIPRIRFTAFHSMRISTLLLVLCAGISTARATTYVAGGAADGISVGFNPGLAQRDPIVIGAAGSLTLMAPGIYTAGSWSISGELKLAAPGNYIIVATTGSIALNGSAVIRGPAGETVSANLSFSHAGDFIMSTPRIDKSVAVRQGVPLPPESAPLVNISTRANLGAGQTHTSGFVVGGRIPRRVLVRAIGPGLGMFGFSNALIAPVLTVFNSQGPVRTSTGWGGDPSLEAAFLNVGAFQLPPNSRDSAMLLTLDPGSYTVQVGGGAGEVLLEIYHVE